MDEQQAADLAWSRNAQLGYDRVADRFWTTVERDDGSWDVELQTVEPDRRPLWKRALEALINGFPQSGGI